MKSVQKTKLKKLIVAVASSEARTIGEPRMYLAPTARRPPPSASAGGSTGEMRLRENAETRNETASVTSVTGAESNCTRKPPRLGPPTNESARLPYRSEFAST